MYWREATAALEAGVMHVWDTLPPHTKTWIIATVETKREISAAMMPKKD